MAARNRRRLEAAAQAGATWSPCGIMLVAMRASPDGRHLAIAVHERLDWQIVGTERAIRSALAKAMWSKLKTKSPHGP